MSDLTPITREEALLDGQDLTPITRQEMFIKHIYDATQEIPTPITREEWFLKKAAEGGGGGDITIVPLSVTNNGTYTAPTGKAYSPVSVDVPLPQNAHLATAITSQPVTDASDYPLPKCDVAVTDADKCEVIVTDDGIIVEDNEPYNYRQSAGGDTELDELIGGTVAWNQLVENGNFASDSGWEPVGGSAVGTLQVENKKATLTIVTSTLDSGIYRPNSLSESVGNHVVIASAFITPSASTSVAYNMYNTTDDSSASTSTSVSANTRTEVTKIWRVGARTTRSGFFVYVNRSQGLSAGATVIVENVQLFDLTQMFGATIAYYVYSLEQSTAGSGVTWLKEHFPKLFDDGYKAYNAGELVSVKASAHVMKDSNDEIIGSYPLSPVELRGLYKLDANNKLYCDGDSYRCDGRVKRRYGIVDLGTLDWIVEAMSESINAFKTSVSNRTRLPFALICSKYPVAVSGHGASNNMLDKTIAGLTATNYVYIRDDSYSDTTAFKAAMSGVMLVYELATPTDEQASPFEKNQVVDAGGTEEYIDDRSVSVPVGHNTKYYNGKAYSKYFPTKSGVVEMADEGIMPMTPMYISANGEIDAEYWE